jgi:hypothetical protein
MPVEFCARYRNNPLRDKKRDAPLSERVTSQIRFLRGNNYGVAVADYKWGPMANVPYTQRPKLPTLKDKMWWVQAVAKNKNSYKWSTTHCMTKESQDLLFDDCCKHVPTSEYFTEDNKKCVLAWFKFFVKVGSQNDGQVRMRHIGPLRDVYRVTNEVRRLMEKETNGNVQYPPLVGTYVSVPALLEAMGKTGEEEHSGPDSGTNSTIAMMASRRKRAALSAVSSLLWQQPDAPSNSASNAESTSSSSTSLKRKR